MKSGVSYLDIQEASHWIAAKFAGEGLPVSEEIVSRVLHLETLFMEMSGLAEAGDKITVRAGYLRREAAWVVDPRAQVQGHDELSQKEEGQHRHPSSSYSGSSEEDSHDQ